MDLEIGRSDLRLELRIDGCVGLDVLQLDLLGLIGLLADLLDGLGEAGAHLANGFAVGLGPRAGGHPECRNRIGSGRGEEFGGVPVADIGRHDPRPDRLHDHDAVDRAALEQIEHLGDRRLDDVHLSRLQSGVLQPLSQHDFGHAVDAGRGDALALEILNGRRP